MKTMNKKPSFKAMLIAGLTGWVLSSPAFAQEDVERYRDELDRAQEEHMPVQWARSRQARRDQSGQFFMY